MAEKTPVRVVFNASNVATGMAEFQSGDAVGIEFGGTGLNAIGSAGQTIKVNAAGTALEFGAEGDLSITNLVAPTNADLTLTTSGTGNIVLDAITIRGTTITSADSSTININDNVEIDGNLVVTGTVDFNDQNISNVGSLSIDSISGDADTNTSITFSGSDVITIATGGSGRLTIGDGALSPVTDNEIDLGTSSLEFKDAFFDGTVTTDALTVSATSTLADTNITGNLTVTGTLDLGDSNFTNVGSLQLDSIAGDGDTNTSITFSGSDVITIATGGSGRLTVGDGALSPVTDSQIDLGTSSLYYKDAYIDSITTTGNVSIGGNLDVTGTLDLSDSNFTNVGALQLDSIAGDGDTNTSITFSGSDVITVATGGSTALTVNADQTVTFSGAVAGTSADFDGGVTIDNITIDGTQIDLSSGDLTIDVAGDLILEAGADVNIPANIGLTFGDDGEKIEGNGTDLTIASSNDLNLTATTDINVPANVGLTFGDDGEKIEGDGTDLTIASSNDIKLDAAGNSVRILDSGVDIVTFVNAGGSPVIQSRI